jgi:hypothetical protein
VLVNFLKGIAPYLAVTLICVLSFGAGYANRGHDEARRAAQVAVALQVEADRRMAEALDRQAQIHAEQIRELEVRAQQRQVVRTIVKEAAKDVADAPVTLECAASPAVTRAVSRLRDLEAARAGRS